MKTRTFALALVLLAVPLAARAPDNGRLAPTRLRCEYAVDPLGVDMAKPRLFWQVESANRGERQTAWHILAASSSDTLAADRGDLWDSGRVESDNTTHIQYGGAALASSQRVHWKVRVWDRHGRPSSWSAPATWTMGVLTAQEWRGIWIAAPAATETLLLRAILHLRLEYGDGRTELIGTNGSWRVLAGPITYSSIYGGEDYDARLEPRGWDMPGFDDRSWAHAVPVIRLEGELKGHSAGSEPIRPIETLHPAGVRTFSDGTSVYDFGQNASFMPRIRVAGPAGSTVRLTPAEVVTEDGRIFRATMGSAARGSSWWRYTKSTDAEETWFPRFYYVGSRYVQAESFAPGEAPPIAVERPGAPPPAADSTRLPRLLSIDAVIVHSSAEPAGTFACANPRLNRIRDLVRWAQRSNMVSVLTDCPHREKLGWIEQFHLNGPSIRYEFDMARLFAKAMRDMAEAQTDEGLVPNIAPEYTVFTGSFRAAAEWGAAFILVPWQQYLFDGDVELLREHYGAMTRYVAHLDSRAPDSILSDGLGDWYDFDLEKPGRANLTPPPFTATAYYYLDVATLAQIARVLGKAGDADAFGRKAAVIRDRFNREFFDAATLSYGTGSQASFAIPPTPRPSCACRRATRP